MFRGAFEHDVVDRVVRCSSGHRRREGLGAAAGDHFAAPGVNDRVWNALEKLAVTDPGAFVDYYANDVVALAATSWLGPGYQVTSQVNVVNPGGAGQTVHRDYHLGFQSPKTSAEFPTHVHAVSPVLTLQGAVAHCDMPVATGPTLYLPHSQKYASRLPRLLAARVPGVLRRPSRAAAAGQGDAVLLQPRALPRRRAEPTTDVRRMANLLQVSSPFGRAMETVDRRRVVEAVYPVLLSRKASGMPPARVGDVVAAAAEGYAFPTNLDRDQPVNGMSPATQADLVRRALGEAVSVEELRVRLAAHEHRTRSH